MADMLHAPVLMPVPDLDIEVGIHHRILELLTADHWEDARQACIRHAGELHKAGYQADGIRVVAGKTWLEPFAEQP
jgi:hypothetical protein